jgi:hypothetical protein
MEKEKSKCEKCNKDAVIIENKKYYCADCYIKIKNIPTKEDS